MGRLIDADKLKDFIDDCGICAICPQKAPRCSYDCDFPEFVTEKWNVAIDAQPTIDAVRVVRCKECMFSEVYQNDSSGVMGRFCEAFTQVRMVTDDDFCSYGERRDRP